MGEASVGTKPDSIPLRLSFLGPFRLECAGRTIHLSTRRVESLPAYLVLHPQPHLCEKLAALLWGGSLDAQARHSLHTAPVAISRSPISLYAGDLLSDFYDDWILTERERLRAIYLGGKNEHPFDQQVDLACRDDRGPGGPCDCLRSNTAAPADAGTRGGTD